MEPRERLLQHGPGALSDAELLSVLLGRPAPRSTERLLEKAGGLGQLLHADHRTLRSYGLREARASQLLAHLELAKRGTRASLPDGEILDEPEKVAAYVAARHAVEDQEIMGAFYLDVRGQVLADEVLFRGTLGALAVEPRKILRQALRHRASKFILWHTHPSGQPSPSAEDFQFTRQVAAAARIVGVYLVGHLVVGNGGRYTTLEIPF